MGCHGHAPQKGNLLLPLTRVEARSLNRFLALATWTFAVCSPKETQACDVSVLRIFSASRRTRVRRSSFSCGKGIITVRMCQPCRLLRCLQSGAPAIYRVIFGTSERPHGGVRKAT